MVSDAWGVDDGYWDAGGGWHETSAETARALRIAMGSDDGGADPGPPAEHPLRVTHLGEAAPVDAPADLTLEDGTELAVEGTLPPDLPIGYHTLRPRDGAPGDPGWRPTRLVVSPGRCHLPDDLHSWVLTVQLHSCRSDRSWGIGDLGDLRRIGSWASVRGAGLVALNPLHAPLPTDHVQPSPYYPSSRRWRNPLYLQVDELPGASLDPDVTRLGEEARALSGQRLIDRDAVWRLKRAALERLWASAGPGDARLQAWRQREGDALESYARFCALAEHHGGGWTSWPAEHRHPSSPGVSAFASQHADRVAFWAWVQLLLDDQLEEANRTVPLLQDLAIGVDPDGAEAWSYQDLLAARGVRVGAPPDHFNTAGQDWGLPPFVPWKLRDAGYRPLAELWRSSLREGGGLRIDHVMGLFRLFWLLSDQGPAEGAYVRYPADELLAVLAIESTRAGALVVGEDLGTVEDGVRDRLAMGGILSTRLVWFDWDPPEHFPRQALAAVTTHDLPTVAGVWSHDDVADQRAAGLAVDEEAAWQMRHRVAELSGAGDGGSVEDVIVGVHRRLAGAPSMLVSATIEDALAVTQRPNMPGTVSERPNWSLALPLPLDEVLADPLLNKVAASLREGRRLTAPEPPLPPPEPVPDPEPEPPTEATPPEEPPSLGAAEPPTGATEEPPTGATGAPPTGATEDPPTGAAGEPSTEAAEPSEPG
jgi:4-alpha-glucanotransferase